MRFMLSMSKRVVLGLSILLLAVSSFVLNAAPANAATYEVKMGADNGMLSFVPKVVKAKPGDTIKFVNNKLAPHNAVFEGSSDVAKTLSHKGLLFAPGESFEETIPADAAPGEYTYYCEPHRGAGMQAKIVVE